jgi:DNA mismatch endonuclease (patch repair protein)
MDTLTREQRRKNMQAIKCKNSKIEQLLASILWKNGIRYRRNNNTIFGKPDFTLRRYKIAIFCDSEFFHGKDWNKHKHDIKSNIEYWIDKIETNIKRDQRVNKQLKEDGWNVIRFWGSEILQDPYSCVNLVQEEICKYSTS